MFIPLKYVVGIACLFVSTFVVMFMFLGSESHVDIGKNVSPEENNATDVSSVQSSAKKPMLVEVSSEKSEIVVSAIDHAEIDSSVESALDVEPLVAEIGDDQINIAPPTQNEFLSGEGAVLAFGVDVTQPPVFSSAKDAASFVGETYYTEDGQILGDTKLDSGGPLVEYDVDSPEKESTIVGEVIYTKDGQVVVDATFDDDSQQPNPHGKDGVLLEETSSSIPGSVGASGDQETTTAQANQSEHTGTSSITVFQVLSQIPSQDLNDQGNAATQSDLSSLTSSASNESEPIDEVEIPPMDEDLESLALRDENGGYTSKTSHFRIYGDIVPYGTARVSFLEDVSGISGTFFIVVSGVTQDGYEFGLYHREYLVYPKEETVHEAYPLSLTTFGADGYVRVTMMVCAEGLFTDDGECYDPHPLIIDRIEGIVHLRDPGN